MTTSVVVDKIPNCDFCKEPTPAYADGQTKMGPWANMCEPCFDMYGVGLGLGKGQRLLTKKDETVTMHTPGPWSTGTQGGDGRVVYVGADMMFVPGSGPVTKANAELIAAAPKLQAIVEGFLATLDTNDAHQVHRYYDANIELFNLAIDTIQELRGEAEVETVTIDADGEPVTIEYKNGLPHLVPINEEWWEE